MDQWEGKSLSLHYCHQKKFQLNRGLIERGPVEHSTGPCVKKWLSKKFMEESLSLFLKSVIVTQISSICSLNEDKLSDQLVKIWLPKKFTKDSLSHFLRKKRHRHQIKNCLKTLFANTSLEEGESFASSKGFIVNKISSICTQDVCNWSLFWCPRTSIQLVHVLKIWFAKKRED